MSVKARILAIDDNVGILSDYRKILAPQTSCKGLDELESELFGAPTKGVETLNVELFTATQGHEGVELFKKERVEQAFDAVFVDMRMPPGWDGLRTIREIWNIEPDQFVVLCSAYSDYSFAELREALGKTPNFLILNKPFSPEEILQIVSSILDRESDRVRAEKQMAADLRVAIRNRQLSTAFQPLVCLSTGRILGYETLCRWQVDGKVVAYPDQFVEVAERRGLICELGDFVAAEAVELAVRLLPGWTDRSFPLVTVNVSPSQLSHRFVAYLDKLTSDAGLPVAALGIEVTESGDILSDDGCIAIVDLIQASGYHVLLDDFGTGHSCLANIARVPFDTVKLDRSFCMSLPDCESSSLLLEAFGKLMRQLGKKSLVEGVETGEQEAIVRSFQYTVGQGYLYARPMSREAAIELFFADTTASFLNVA